MYMQAESSGPDANLAVWFDLGGVYLNSDDHPNRFLEAEKFIMRFAIFVAKEKTKVELANQEKEMKRLESLLKRLEQNNERYHRDIEVAKEKIRTSESNIETNLVEQSEAKKLIELQLETLRQVREKLAGLN